MTVLDKAIEDLRKAFEKKDAKDFEGALESFRGAVIPPMQVTLGARRRADSGDVTAVWLCGMFPEQTGS